MRLGAGFEVQVPTAHADDVRRAVLPCLEEDERRHERALERMIEEAVAQSAEVLPLRQYPEELAQRDRIAAVLRF